MRAISVLPTQFCLFCISVLCADIENIFSFFYYNRLNLVWADGFNVFALPLATGVLAPTGLLLSPAVSANLMSLSTVIVAINAQLLRNTAL
jgi:hypothetical protein